MKSVFVKLWQRKTEIPLKPVIFQRQRNCSKTNQHLLPPMAVIQKAVYNNEVSGPQLSYKKPKILRYDCDNIT